MFTRNKKASKKSKFDGFLDALHVYGDSYLEVTYNSPKNSFNSNWS